MKKSIEITCPECGHEFEPTESYDKLIQHQVDEHLQKIKADFASKKSALKKKETEIEKLKNSLQDQIDGEVKKKTDELKAKAEKDAAEKVTVEIDDLKEQLKEKANALSESHKAELELRKQVRLVEEKEKELELEIEKQTQARLDEFKEKTLKDTEESYKLKILEKEKKIKEIEAKLEAAKRSANQGSQQTQGEAIEEEFEKQLEASFPVDHFQAVPKGVNGADLIQEIINSTGSVAGSMLWEFKNTKVFKNDWIEKLKGDQRTVGADAAILVSRVLPKDAAPIELIDGVFVVSYAIAIPFAATLRKSIEELSYARVVTQGQGQKMQLIYSYLTGPEFKRKVKCIVDAFETMKDQLEKEKKAYKRIWSAREKMLENVIDSATSMYGDIEGIAGSEAPQIDGLKLPEPEIELLEPAEEVVN